MERCECFFFCKFKVCTKKCPCKNISDKQLFQLISCSRYCPLARTHTSALAATHQWHCRWCSAWTEPDRN